jgi:hypothetical protein
MQRKLLPLHVLNAAKSYDNCKGFITTLAP